MQPKKIVSYRLSPHLLQAIEKEAKAQHRTRSNLVELILAAALLDDDEQ